MVKEIVIKGGKYGYQEDVLYLTDDLPLLKKLCEKGKKAAAVLTDENRGEDFSGIPYAAERIDELEYDDYEKLYRRLAGQPWDILETKRCRLREMTAQDMDRLYEICAGDCAGELSESLPQSREEGRKYAEDYRKYVYSFYGYGIWVIEEKRSGTVIGRAGVERKGTDIELGYMIARPWRRHGYAFEVCSAVVRYVREEIGGDRLVSRIRRENTASIGLIRKLGFRKAAEAGADGMDVYEADADGGNETSPRPYGQGRYT